MSEFPACTAIERLLEVMATLRHPEHGCPWDVEQTFASIAPYTIEEAYEVAEAIRHHDLQALREELGDLLLQVVYHARMAEEHGAFDFAQVAQTIADKMVRRHPHVFGADRIADAEAQTRHWEEHKAAERAAQARSAGREPSALDGVALGLPALARAEKLQRRARRVGFDWPAATPVLEKVEEELAELRHEIETKAPPERVQDEVGDLLFAAANLARHLNVDAEAALLHSNAKFERRFRRIEALLLARGGSIGGAPRPLDELESLWQQAKAEETAGEDA